MKQLRAQLLGRFQLVANERALELPQARLQSLLGYLLIHRDSPQPRQHLSFLFWPDNSEKQAHTNLRNLLYQLRGVWPQAEQFLDLGRNHLSWQPEVEITLDVASFEAAIREAQGEPDALDALQRARLLYTGDLLHPLLEEWVLPERERLRLLFLSVMDALVVQYSDSRQYRSAIPFAEELLLLDPLREESYRRLMRLHAATHDRARALQAYHQCVTILQRELDVEPHETTTALYQSLLKEGQGEAIATPWRQAPPDSPVNTEVASEEGAEISETNYAPLRNFPAQLTPLVGRTRELSQIVAQLVEPDCRLLTLVGPGGIGKTRLALSSAEIMRTRNEFCDGIYFVGLASVTTSAMMPSVLTSALGISLHEEESLLNQLLYHLRPYHALIVLDNYEQLLPDITLVNEILQAAPNIKLLVTSRETLNLRAEVRFAVPGLSYPTLQEQREVDDGSQDYEAVDLFRRVAERIQPDFYVSESMRAEIKRICQLVDGSPLALEMAAGWTRLYDCESIRAQLERDLDFLVVQTRDSVPRHQSMRVVLEYSWQLLTGKEQKILSQLTVLSGSFATNAAMHVTGATPLQLAALLDKALLQREGARFTLHELVRRFAAEKLEQLVARSAKSADALDIQRVYERHARFYLEALIRQTPALFGDQPAQTVRELTGEIDNIRVAWRWASDNQAIDLLADSLPGFARFYERCALIAEAEELLASAIQRLQQWPADDRSDGAKATLLARLLAQRAEMLMQLDEVQRAHAVAVEADLMAVAIGAKVVDEVTVDAVTARAHAHLIIGRIYGDQLFEAEATEHLTHALSLSESSGRSDRLRARIYNELGNLHRVKGEFARAFAWQQKAHDLVKELGDLDAAAKILFDIGIIHWDAWQVEETLTVCRQTLALEEQLENQSLQARAAFLIGCTYQRIGKLAQAQEYFEQGLRVAEALGLRRYLAECLQVLGSLNIEQGEYEQAGNFLRRATTIYRELDLQVKLVDCSIGFAALAENTGNYEEACQHLLSCFDHFKRLHYQRGMIDVGSSLGRIFRLMGDSEMAAHYLDFVIYASKEEEEQHCLPLACIERALLEMDQGNYETAEAYCNEGLQALQVNEDSEGAFHGRQLFLQGHCILARIYMATGQGVRATIVQQLFALLGRAETEIERAMLHFELWRLTNEREYAEHALTLYQQRYRQKPRFEYVQRIQELETTLTR